MAEKFSRIELLFGKEAIEKLNTKRVIVFGIGGVGGYVCEALARSGIFYFDLVDKDVVSESNINRQIIATTETIGLSKVELMKKRILAINPGANVVIHNCFYLPDNDEFNFEEYDYIVDCVDTVSAKISIITKAYNLGKKVISAMGAGNKLDPTKLVVTDIYKTTVDPLARVMRYELKRRGVKHLKVVYSTEEPHPTAELFDSESGKRIPGSTPFVPSTMGLIIASEIIKDLIKE